MDALAEAARHEIHEHPHGRATSSMFEQLPVDYYGATHVMQQLASFQIPRPHCPVSPFDRTA